MLTVVEVTVNAPDHYTNEDSLERSTLFVIHVSNLTS